MKIFIILGILAAVYLVYLSLTADAEPVKTQVEKPAVEEVSMPDKEFKNAIRLSNSTFFEVFQRESIQRKQLISKSEAKKSWWKFW